MKRARFLGLLAAIVISLVICGWTACRVFAGEIPARWDPVAFPTTGCDTKGYTVHRGTASGTYSTVTPTGNVTAFNLTAPDCTTSFVAVKATCTVGGTVTPSAQFSNEISGWPRITVSSIAPAQWFAGQTVQVTVTGTNLRSGLQVTDNSQDVMVSAVQWASCTSMTFTVAVVSSPTAPQTVTLTITNPDNTYLDVPATITAVVIPGTVQNLTRSDLVSTGPAPGPDLVVVDNVDSASVSSSGSWSETAPASTRYPPGGSGTAHVTTATGSTWTWRAGIAGRLAVEAYWTSTSTRDPATVYEIRDGSALLASVTRDQRISGQWTSASALGTHQFVTGQASVTVRKASAGTASVVADAVRFTRVP